MRINDAILGAVLLAFALAVFGYARTLPAMPGQSVGPDVFPTLIAAGLGAFALMLILGGIRNRATMPAVALSGWARSPKRLGRLALCALLVVFYILAAERLGFMPTAAIILAILLLAMDVGPLLAIALAVGLSIGVHILFYAVLKVPLPWGFMRPFAWW